MNGTICQEAFIFADVPCSMQAKAWRMRRKSAGVACQAVRDVARVCGESVAKVLQTAAAFDRGAMRARRDAHAG